MQQKEFLQLLQKYKQGVCTSDEEAFIEKWYAEISLKNQDTLSPHESEVIKSRAWTNLLKHTAKSKGHRTLMNQPEKSFITVNRTVYAIAASLLIFIGVFAYFSAEQKQEPDKPLVMEKVIFNNTKVVKEINLADGSTVHLTPQSRLTFPTAFDKLQRMVSLDGEAFFEISRDTLRPFIVNTNEVLTKVLGTSFTVSAFKNDKNITVSVRTGKVSVTPKLGAGNTKELPRETILTPNQKFVYDKDIHKVKKELVDQPLPILSTEYVKRIRFQSAPVREIFEELEKIYGVNIELDETKFASCILTTTIGDGSIRNRLDIICEAINAEYRFVNDKIVVSGEGCNKK